MAAGRIARLEELSWEQVAALPGSSTVVLLLSGPLEQHGPHLPLGTDLFEAGLVRERLAARLAEAGWQVLLAPPLPYTTAVLSRTYPGSVSVRKAHLVPFFTDVLNSFASNGLSRLVVVSQHMDPPHIQAWEDACRAAAEQSGARALEGYERILFELFGDGTIGKLLGEAAAIESHAGAIETAITLVARPDLVGDYRRLPAVLGGFPSLSGIRDFHEVGDGSGYTGDPARASAELGERLLEEIVSRFFERVCGHLGFAP